MLAAVEPTTQAGYQSAGRSFRAWLRLPEPPPFSVQRLSLDNALDYLVSLYDDHKCYASANKFRCWLAQEEEITLGFQRLSRDTRFLRCLKGYRRSTLEWSTITCPFRLQHLNQLLALPSLRATARHMAALAYSCLLRYGEVQQVFSGESWLERCPTGWLLHLRRSKTDPLRRGCQVFFEAARTPAELHSYLDTVCARHSTWELPPSRRAWRKWLTAILPGARFHGFRHGRVVDLTSSGVPKETIMHLGRWSSIEGFACYSAHE